MEIIGEIAGLLTSVCFAITATILTRAGQQVGSVIANRTRLVFALAYLLILNLVLFGQPLPFGAAPQRWMWLALSGVIGLAVGDAFLIQSYIMIGPRLGMLLLSLSTIFAAVEAWLLFGETLGLLQIIGIAVTLAGTVWVIFERGSVISSRGSAMSSRLSAVSPRGSDNGKAITPSALGVLCGLVGALGQGTGLVLSKQGMLGTFSPISGNAIRMLAGALALWLLTFLQGQAPRTVQVLRQNPSALKLLAVVALVGPVIGISLSLLAVQLAPVGVASMLTSLSPVLMLPIGHFVNGEKLGWGAIAGTIVAMCGVALLLIN